MFAGMVPTADALFTSAPPADQYPANSEFFIFECIGNEPCKPIYKWNNDNWAANHQPTTPMETTDTTADDINLGDIAEDQLMPKANDCGTDTSDLES